MRIRDIISMYSSALCELAMAALGFAIIALIGLQLLARLAGADMNASGILLFSWQIIVLMALWPGQTFWTIRRSTPCGLEHSIIGVPSDDDMRVMNRRMARRMSNRVRD